MSSRETMDESVEYRARLIGDALRRQAWIIVVAALLGAFLGYGASLARPGAYVASGSVLILPLSGNPYSPGVTGQDSQVSIETEAKVASSDAVSALVGRALGESDLGKLQKGVTVTVPPSTTFIQITFSSTSPTFARKAAQAYADSFLAYRTQRAETVTEAQIASLTDQQNSVKQQLSQAQNDNNQPLAKTYQSQNASLQAQISALKASKPNPGSIVSPPTTPKKRSGFGPPLYVVGGMIFGLIGGIALALARQRRDDRVLHPDEIEVAGIPLIATWGGGPQRSAEATRLIRARALAVDRKPTVIVVGGSRQLDGRSHVAAQLADSLANVGRSVVFANLVGDPETVPGDAVPYGLTDLLTGRRSSMRDLLVELDSNLTVLPKGRASLADAIEFLDASRLRAMIDELPQRADFIVLHIPSLTDSVGETMMEIAHLNVVAVTLARTTRTELALVRERGADHVVACVTPRTKRRLRKAIRRSRKEGSTRVSRSDDGFTLIDDEDGDKDIPA